MFLKRVLSPFSKINLVSYFNTLSGYNWYDKYGDASASRTIRIGRKLTVATNDYITFQNDIAAISITGTAIGSYDINTKRWTISTDGIIYEIFAYDVNGVLLDDYKLTEGFGTTIYSVLRVSKTANLSALISWGYQSLYPSYSNMNGYLLSSGVNIPPLVDRSKFADGSAADTINAYLGKVRYNARFRRYGAFKTPTAGGGWIREYAPWQEGGLSAITLTCWVKKTGTDLCHFGLVDETGATTIVSINSYPESGYYRVKIGSVSVIRTFPATIVSNTWYLLEMVYNGSLGNEQRVRLWQDGVELTGQVAPTWPTTLPTGNYYWSCGGSNGAYNRSASFREFRVYRRALSDAEVTSIYAGTDTAIPDVIWTMDEAIAYGNEGAGTSFGLYGRIGDQSGNSRYALIYGVSGLVDYCDYGYPICLLKGWSLWSTTVDGTTHYRYVPYLMTGVPEADGTDSWTHPITSKVYIRVRNYPAITDGWNSVPYQLDFQPDYSGHVAQETADIYDLVEDRGVGGFPYGDYRDVTLTWDEVLSMRTDSVDASLRRRLAYRRIEDDSNNLVGVDRLVHYGRQLSTGEWERLLRYLRTKTI